MQHDTQTAVEHIVTLSGDEADILGQYLLNTYDQACSSDRHFGTTETGELVGRLANYLNGVE
jgi:hypothetical protein